MNLFLNIVRHMASSWTGVHVKIHGKHKSLKQIKEYRHLIWFDLDFFHSIILIPCAVIDVIYLLLREFDQFIKYTVYLLHRISYVGLWPKIHKVNLLRDGL